jgi:hypothetical protein
LKSDEIYSNEMKSTQLKFDETILNNK